MQAFHNDPAIKAKYQARLKEHRAKEQLVQGIGFNPLTRKGCSVGCTLDSYDHYRYPIELGLPEWLAWLEDVIFERLPKKKAEDFAEDLLALIPVGADVEKVRVQLAIRRHKRDLERLNHIFDHGHYILQCRMAIRAVITWLEEGENELKRDELRSLIHEAAKVAAAQDPLNALTVAAAARSAFYSTGVTELAPNWSAADASIHNPEFWEWEAMNLLELLMHSK